MTSAYNLFLSFRLINFQVTIRQEKSQESLYSSLSRVQSEKDSVVKL